MVDIYTYTSISIHAIFVFQGSPDVACIERGVYKYTRPIILQVFSIERNLVTLSWLQVTYKYRYQCKISKMQQQIIMCTVSCQSYILLSFPVKTFVAKSKWGECAERWSYSINPKHLSYLTDLTHYNILCFNTYVKYVSECGHELRFMCHVLTTDTYRSAVNCALIIECNISPVQHKYSLVINYLDGDYMASRSLNQPWTWQKLMLIRTRTFDNFRNIIWLLYWDLFSHTALSDVPHLRL